MMKTYFIFDRLRKNIYLGIASDGAKSAKGIYKYLGKYMRYVYNGDLNMCVRLLANHCKLN